MELSVQCPTVFAVVTRSNRTLWGGVCSGSSPGAVCTSGFGRHSRSPLQTHSCSLLTDPTTECGSACLSNTRTREVCSRLPRRCWVRYAKSITSPENSSMRRKQKLFWDEHAYFTEHGIRMLEWLESLDICTSNSSRILRRNKCTLYYALWQEILCKKCLEQIGTSLRQG